MKLHGITRFYNKITQNTLTQLNTGLHDFSTKLHDFNRLEKSKFDKLQDWFQSIN